jgi:hypothetical protein
MQDMSEAAARGKGSEVIQFARKETKGEAEQLPDRSQTQRNDWVVALVLTFQKKFRWCQMSDSNFANLIHAPGMLTR